MSTGSKAGSSRSKKGKGKAAIEDVEEEVEIVAEKRTPEKKKPSLLDKMATPFKRKKSEVAVESEEVEELPNRLLRPPSFSSSRSFAPPAAFDSYSQTSLSQSSTMPPPSQSSFASSHRGFSDRDRTVDRLRARLTASQENLRRAQEDLVRERAENAALIQSYEDELDGYRSGQSSGQGNRGMYGGRRGDWSG